MHDTLFINRILTTTKRIRIIRKMAVLCRLAGRQLCSQLANHERNSLMFIRAVTMKPEPYKKQSSLKSFDKYNMALGRPMSPHLTIYAPQLTSMLSVTHRMTGMVLTGYVYMFGMGTLLIDDFATFVDYLPLNDVMMYALKFMLALPFSYHFLNGIRHLLWDVGKFLTLKDVYFTGYTMLALTGAASVGLSLL